MAKSSCLFFTNIPGAGIYPEIKIQRNRFAYYPRSLYTIVWYVDREHSLERRDKVVLIYKEDTDG